jgi:hypothetical protein
MAGPCAFSFVGVVGLVNLQRQEKPETFRTNVDVDTLKP